MWSFLRLIVVTLALAGFVGQASARAMPMAPDASSSMAAMSMMDCADMPGMGDMTMAQDMAHDAGKTTSPAETPCKKMTPDCIAKMGCGAVVVLPPASFALASTTLYADVTFQVAERDHDGLDPSPPFIPPISLA
ncbi:hypothetical protein [Caulobacter sp. BK020]|uniref:hypothetical protein n=1 Tax=Caulobacter sp. BK020 TaxID=2512117 RepID=UPI001045A2BF|nr:hypothetical protein [Caulobacter sp. BK020]TCS11905.1 hypothetical protein EV278_11617 [Caulobacter sp. BK020]